MNTRSCALAGLLVAVVLAGADGAWANNLTLTNVTIKPLDATRTCARFDLCWENSWRYTNINHDAAWVFFKIKPEGRTAWEHVTLETNGHDTGTGTAVEIIVPEDRVGCLIRRAEEGAGTVSVTNLKVAWNFASNSLVKTDRVRLQALALEMVYVAEGSFWVGDGTTENIHGHFEAGTNGTPFQITNEAYEIILGGGTAGSLGNNNGDGMATRDDFNDATSQTLPTNFPKGYAAFYCMKYEFTQGQYRDFLNTLTRAQQTTRTASQIANYFALSGGALAYRNGIRCPATVPLEPEPIVFGCDGNNNQVLNETDDAMDRACNFLSGAGDLRLRGLGGVASDDRAGVREGVPGSAGSGGKRIRLGFAYRSCGIRGASKRRHGHGAGDQRELLLLQQFGLLSLAGWDFCRDQLDAADVGGVVLGHHGAERQRVRTGRDRGENYGSCLYGLAWRRCPDGGGERERARVAAFERRRRPRWPVE